MPVYTPLSDTAEDLIRKYGITAEQSGDGSPDLRWLLDGEAGGAHWYSVTREQVVEGLRPLLALPVEHMLATHGGPTDWAAPERALS